MINTNTSTYRPSILIETTIKIEVFKISNIKDLIFEKYIKGSIEGLEYEEIDFDMLFYEDYLYEFLSSQNYESISLPIFFNINSIAEDLITYTTLIKKKEQGEITINSIIINGYRERKLFLFYKNMYLDYLDSKNNFQSLSYREKEIISLLKEGLKSNEISNKLNISVNTVSNHRRNITLKLAEDNLLKLINIYNVNEFFVNKNSGH